jgi:hypothetical protein
MTRSFCALLVLLSPSLLLAQDTPQSPPSTPPTGANLIQIEVTLIELSTLVEYRDDGYTNEEIRELLESWKQQGVIDRTMQARLTTVEATPASIQVGMSQPTLSGRTSAPRGAGQSPFRNVYQHVDTGTLIGMTPRLEEGGAIRVELTVEQTRLESPRAAKAEEADVVPPGVERLGVKSTVHVSEGKFMVMGGFQSRNEDGGSSSKLVLLKATRR